MTRRKIATGRYPRSAQRQSDDKNSIPRLPFPWQDFLPCRRREKAILFTIRTTARGSFVNRPIGDIGCRFQRIPSHAHVRVCVRVCSIGRAIEGIVPLNERKINPGGLVITSYASLVEGIRSNRRFISGQACRNAIGTFCTHLPLRSLLPPHANLCRRVMARLGRWMIPVGDSGRIIGMPRMTRIA